MITKFKTQNKLYGILIEKVEVLRETARSVFVERGGRSQRCERREAKESEYNSYFDTWEEAHKHIQATARIKIENARRVLEKALATYERIENMKKPKEDKK